MRYLFIQIFNSSMGLALYGYKNRRCNPKREVYLSEGWDGVSGNVTWTPNEGTVSDSTQEVSTALD